MILTNPKNKQALYHQLPNNNANIKWILILLSGDVEPNPGPDTANLKIYHINIRSIVTKIDEVLAEVQDFDIVGFTETHLDESINSNEIQMPDYQPPIRRDRNRHGGGIAVYVGKHIPFKRRTDLESDQFESELHRLRHRMLMLSASLLLICTMFIF